MAPKHIGTFLGTSKDLIYIGDYVYAYAKPIAVAGTELTLLEASTGSGIIKCEVVFQFATQGNQDFQYRIYLNGINVFNQFMDNNTGTGDMKSNQLFAIPLLIPPRTTIKCTAENVTATDSESQAVMLVGRVYA